MVAASGAAVWPLSWYWRGVDVWWALPEEVGELRLVICDPEEEGAAGDILGPGWASERIPLRSWWLMYEGDPAPADWMRYFLTRRYWGEIGSTEVVVFRRVATDTGPGPP